VNGIRYENRSLPHWRLKSRLSKKYSIPWISIWMENYKSGGVING